MFQFNVGVFRGQPVRRLAPQPGAFQYVGLIHGGQFVPAALGQLKPYPQDTFQLPFAVAHGVYGRPTLVRLVAAFGLGIIKAAGQFPYYHQVHTFDHRRFQ